MKKAKKTLIGMLLLTLLVPNVALLAQTNTPDPNTPAPTCDLLPSQK